MLIKRDIGEKLNKLIERRKFRLSNSGNNKVCTVESIGFDYLRGDLYICIIYQEPAFPFRKKSHFLNKLELKNIEIC